MNLNKKHKKEIKRKSKRKKIKKQKTIAKNKLSQLENLIFSFPKACEICAKDFDNSDEDFENWFLTNEKSKLSLYCKECKQNIS